VTWLLDVYSSSPWDDTVRSAVDWVFSDAAAADLFAIPSEFIDNRPRLQSECGRTPRTRSLETKTMNKDRIAGSAKELKGSVKEAVGKGVGDAKLQGEGRADKAEGKIQNAVGGIKDAVKK
jgi:uncharacterized protein YjbJ (UPF0337 family)